MLSTKEYYWTKTTFQWSFYKHKIVELLHHIPIEFHINDMIPITAFHVTFD